MNEKIKNNIRHYLRLFSMPLSLLAVYTTVWVSWGIFDLPSAQAMGEMTKGWFGTYGLSALFASSIFEGALLIGGYFPGIFVIFIGIILASSAYEATAVIITASAGLYIAHVFNYFLGKHGWYRLLAKFGLKNAIDQAQERLAKKGPVAIYSSYWLPSAGALTDTAAGIIHMPLKKFLMHALISTLFWDILVGVIVYNLGDKALVVAAPGSGEKGIMLSILSVWAVVLFIFDFKNTRLQRTLRF